MHRCWIVGAAVALGCVPPASNELYVAPAAAPAAAPVIEAAPPPAPRAIRINGARLGPERARNLAALEAAGGVTLPDGAYWYDATSGAFGAWGQPAAAVIGAGHDLGPPVPANASRGRSGVFINGRQLQDGEVAVLSALIGQRWQRGRYFVDGHGNAGLEGGAAATSTSTAATAATSRGSARTAPAGGSWTRRATASRAVADRRLENPRAGAPDPREFDTRHHQRAGYSE